LEAVVFRSVQKVRSARLAFTAAALAGALTFVAACGGSSSGGGGSSSSAPAGVAGGSAKIAYYLAVDKLDPALTAGGPNYNILTLVYDSLIHIDTDGKPSAGLATAWDFSADLKTLTLTLRTGVTFSDGTALDATAVKANLDRSKNLAGSTAAALLTSFATVDVVDATHVKLNLNKPDALILLDLADRAGMIANPKSFDTLVNKPDGTGMFTMSAYNPNIQLSLTKNAKYWDAAKVKLNNLTIDFIPDTTARLNAVRSGQDDAAQIDPVQIADAESAGLKTLAASAPKYLMLQLNPDLVPQWKDPNVRKAVSMAIDRPSLSNALYLNKADLTGQAFPDFTIGFSKGVKAPFDLDKAKALMSAAGLSAGFSFTLTISSNYKDLAEAVQAELAKLNIKATIDIPAAGYAISDGMWVKRVLQATLTGLFTPFDLATGISRVFQAGGSTNPGNLTSPTIAAALDAARGSADVAVQSKQLQIISKELVEAPLGGVIIVRPQEIVVYNKKLLNVKSCVAGFPCIAGVAVSG
jgi:ABC-type transport system substrate-binding protein